MKLRDLLHPERGPGALLQLAFYALVVAVAFSALSMIVNQMNGADLFLVFLGLVLLSPLAYFIRESRRHRPQRYMSRRGAERTPLMPPNEEQQ
jgi:hypothetical protein